MGECSAGVQVHFAVQFLWASTAFSHVCLHTLRKWHTEGHRGLLGA